MNRLLYLAHPIDRADWGFENAELVIHLAKQMGYIVYQPWKAFAIEPGAAVGPEVEAVNRAVLSQACALLALAPEGKPTVGVWREVEYAKARGIPVQVVGHRQTWSLADVQVWPDMKDATHALAALDRQVASVPGLQPPNNEILFEKLHDGAILPDRSNPQDAGYDLYVSEDTVIPSQSFVDVPCGIRALLPAGTWARVTGRSSTLRRRGLFVADGVIDTGYVGPLFTGVWNLTNFETFVNAGERLGQFVLHTNLAIDSAARWSRSDEDIDAIAAARGDRRGHSGFGSSGS